MFQSNVVKVPEDVVSDIQAKDVAYQTSKEVITQIIDMHKMDADISFMESPVFQAFQKDASGKRLVWEQAKKAMSDKYLPPDQKGKIKEWSLDYYTCELTYKI